MDLPVRMPVLPAHCYSPAPDDGYETRRVVSTTSRQPLQESTGYIQPPHAAWYAQQLEAVTSIPSSIPPMIPPVLRTQSSLGPDYGAPTYTQPQSQRQPHQQQQQQQPRHELQPHGRRRSQGSGNPLMPLLSQQFQTYRRKQADKPDQKWPQILEGWFLDGKFARGEQTRAKRRAVYG